MPSKLWLNLWPNVKLCRLLGSWMPPKLCLNSKPHAKICRLLGSRMLSTLWVKPLTKRQTLQAAGKLDDLQKPLANYD